MNSATPPNGLAFGVDPESVRRAPRVGSALLLIASFGVAAAAQDVCSPDLGPLEARVCDDDAAWAQYLRAQALYTSARQEALDPEAVDDLWAELGEQLIWADEPRHHLQRLFSQMSSLREAVAQTRGGIFAIEELERDCVWLARTFVQGGSCHVESLGQVPGAPDRSPLLLQSQSFLTWDHLEIDEETMGQGEGLPTNEVGYVLLETIAGRGLTLAHAVTGTVRKADEPPPVAIETAFGMGVLLNPPYGSQVALPLDGRLKVFSTVPLWRAVEAEVAGRYAIEDFRVDFERMQLFATLRPLDGGGMVGLHWDVVVDGDVLAGRPRV